MTGHRGKESKRLPNTTFFPFCCCDARPATAGNNSRADWISGRSLRYSKAENRAQPSFQAIPVIACFSSEFTPRRCRHATTSRSTVSNRWNLRRSKCWNAGSPRALPTSKSRRMSRRRPRILWSQIWTVISGLFNRQNASPRQPSECRRMGGPMKRLMRSFWINNRVAG